MTAETLSKILDALVTAESIEAIVAGLSDVCCDRARLAKTADETNVWRDLMDKLDALYKEIDS